MMKETKQLSLLDDLDIGEIIVNNECVCVHMRPFLKSLPDLFPLQNIRDLAREAGAADPDLLARQLLLLKEGAIVAAHLGMPGDPAADAKESAIVLMENAGIPPETA